MTNVSIRVYLLLKQHLPISDALSVDMKLVFFIFHYFYNANETSLKKLAIISFSLLILYCCNVTTCNKYALKELFLSANPI